MKTDLKRWSSSTEAHFEFSNFQLQSQPDFQWVNGFSGFISQISNFKNKELRAGL